MAQQARDEAGNIWELDAQGNAVRLVQAASAPSPMTIGTPDPAAAYAAPKAQADLDRTRIQTQADQARLATAPYDARKAAADASKAEADAEKARRDVAAAQSTASPEQQKGMAALADDEVIAALARARTGVSGGGAAGYYARLGNIPGIGGLIEPQAVVDLRGDLGTVSSRITLDTLAKLKQASPTGASGLGSLTEREGALLRDSIAGLDQAQSPDKLLESLGNVEKHYRNVRAILDGQDFRDPTVAERYGMVTAPAKEQMQLAQGETREEADPALAGVNSHIRGMLGAGRSKDEIVGYANSIRPGLGDSIAPNVDQAVRFRSQNPRVPLDRYSIEVDRRQVPLTDLDQTINSAAQSPFGAYMAAAADTLTAGTLDNLQDNPALARAGMSEVAARNPGSSIAGMLSGGALSGALAEGAVARAGVQWAPRVADVLYGSAYGAGSADEGSRLEGAGWGALGGAVGGEIGRRGTAAIGRSVRGVQDEAVQMLRDRNVPLTVGQILGGALKAKEDRLAGFSGIGDQITDRRRAGIRAFNQAAFDEGMQPIGQQGMNQIGEEGIDTARAAISGPGGAYDQALNGVSLVPDQQFQQQIASALTRGSGLARVGPEFDTFVKESVAPHFSAPNGQIDGRQVQDILQQVRGANFGNDAMGSLASDATREIEGAVMDLAGRQSPGSMEALGNANTAYRNLNILADAVGRGINQGGDFMPSQLGSAARANATKFGGKIAAATPDRPFYELQQAGQQVLPSRVPDSGTAGRTEQNGGITAATRSILRNLVNGPLYAEGTQEAINRVLLDRTPGVIAAGDWIERQARVAGLLSRPIALTAGPLAVASDY